MVSHLTIGVDGPVEAFADPRQDLQPNLPIILSYVDFLPPVAP